MRREIDPCGVFNGVQDSFPAIQRGPQKLSQLAKLRPAGSKKASGEILGVGPRGKRRLKKLAQRETDS